MSFMKTLSMVAIGFAAAKGMQKYKQVGGMDGLKDMLDKAGDNPMAAQMAKMAEQFGVSDGAEKLKEMMSGMGGGMAATAGAAGIADLMNAMRGAAQAGSAQSADMMSAMMSGTPGEALMEAQAKLMLRAMIQAAKADGEIDADEQAAILDQLGTDIDPEERAYVQEQMAAPLDIEALARDTEAHMREQVYATSVATIRGDDFVEGAYLKQLASALGLSEETCDQIHRQMGLAPLP